MRYPIKKNLNNDLIIQFTESMSALLHAGMSLQDALFICAEANAKKQSVSLCRCLLQYLTDGKQFHDALALFAPAFSSLYIALIKLGETTNSLDKIFSQLAVYLKRNRDIKQKIKQALAYPLTICVTAIAIILFIIIFIFPRMEAIFAIFNSGGNAYGMRENVQRFTHSIFYVCGIICAMITSIIFVLRARSCSRSLALRADSFILRIPIIGNIITILSTSDFAFSMEILSSSRIPFIDALEQSQNSIANSAFRSAIEQCIHDIKNGVSISKAFQRQKVFPPYVRSWIAIGENAGSIEKAFSELHAYFEHESTALITNITSALEPLFILIAGIMIIILVWRFVIPIFSLIGGL